MKKFITVFKFELMQLLKNKGLIITAILTAAVIVFLSFLPKILSGSSSSGKTDSATADKKPVYALVLTKKLAKNGFDKVVEHEFGVTVKLVENDPETLQTLIEQIKNEEVERAFVFTGDTTYNYLVNNAKMSDTGMTRFSEVLKVFLQKLQLSDLGLTDAAALDNFFALPISAYPIVLGKNENFTYALSIVLNVLMYMIIISFSSILSYNIVTEKISKTVEVLITSTDTTTLLFGKVFALLAFIILDGIFLGTVAFFSLKNLEGSSDIVAQILQMIGTGNLISIILFIILGTLLYLCFISIFAAKINQMEEAGQAVFPVILLILVPYFLVFNVHDMNLPIIKVFSYIPFFSPILMPIRFMQDTIPSYRVWISLTILAVSAGLLGYLAAKLYRKGILNTGNKKEAQGKRK